jgi:serine/threonine protein kinase
VTPPLKVLDGRYQLKGRLGKGAMGSVWQAYDMMLDRLVAVKQLSIGWYDDEELTVRRERVRREAIALARVEHPVVVSIHDLIYDDGDPWIVMGYVAGMPLDQIITQGSPLGEREVAAIGLAALQGLMACHAKDVYHRDVKPANIIRGDDGAIRLVDFGIAQIAGLDPLTEDSKILGTLDFLDPELFRARPTSPATDLWALGVTLYMALEGRSPFGGATKEATIAAILSKNPPEPRSRGALAALVLAMLDKRPAARPDAVALLAALQRIADGGPPAARVARPDPVPSTSAGRSRPMPQSASGAADWTGSTRQQPWQGSQVQPAQPKRRRQSTLSGLSASDAAEAVAKWPSDRAAAELLALEDRDTASIINSCGDADAGRLLSAIAAEQPTQAGKFIEMVRRDRRGRLLNHMSSPAAASVLVLPPQAWMLRALAVAYDATIAGALAEMPSANAASLIMAIANEDEGRVVAVFSQAAPAIVAGILRHVTPPSRSQRLLRQLPVRFQELVAKRSAEGA